MLFPREINCHPELTPRHVKDACISYTPVASGPATRRGPMLQGRAVVAYNGKGWRCSRLSYHLNVAKIPRSPESLKRGLVLHKCDNQWCVNPEHLYIGTASRNTKDIYERNKTIKERQSESHKGNQCAKGYKFTKEQRAKLSTGLIGNTNKLGKKESEEAKLKKSAAAKIRAARDGMPKGKRRDK